MANSIIHKRSSIPGDKPELNLPLGELAVNTSDGVLFTKKNAGSDVMVEFNGSETPHLFRLFSSAPGIPNTGYTKLYPKNNGSFYKRDATGGEFILWDSQNHGHDSGLNADMLDGQHASAFALQYHTHTNYVAKLGDTMSGDLSIIKSSSMPSVDAYYRVAAQDNSSDASQAWFNAYSSQGVGNIQIYGIRTVSGTPTTYNMLYAEFNVNRGNSLHLGDTAFDNLAILADTDVIGNATHVYVADVDGWVKKVPVSSFGGGGGGGTVTSVGLSMPNIFSVSGSPVTSSGILTAYLVSQTKNTVLAAPSSSNGVPSFRALVAADIPSLPYDNYYSWRAMITGSTAYDIMSTQWGGTAYKGMSFKAGNNVTLSMAAGSNETLELTINASSSGGGLTYSSVALNQSPAPISANTWTDIPVTQIATWGSGSYLINGLVQVAKSTTGAGLIAARIILSNGTVIASGEMYHYSTTTNRMTFSLSGIYAMGGGAAVTAKLQIWSNQTGWSAIATTLGSNSANATKIELIKIT